MKKPELSGHHLRLRDLVGEYEGDETLGETPVSPAGKATGVISLRTILDGFFLSFDYGQLMGGKVSMQGKGIIGWDAAQKCYTLHWFDTFGSPPSKPGLGQWKEGALVFEHTYPKHLGRTILEAREGELGFKVEMNFEGKGWSTAVDGKYRPVEATSQTMRTG
jgi:hypothetical protein